MTESLGIDEGDQLTDADGAPPDGGTTGRDRY